MDPREALVDAPADPDPPWLVLAHGAGAPMDHEWMQELTRRLVHEGVAVARFEFPYMARRRRTGKKGGPDRAEVLRASFLDAISLAASLAGDPARLFLGGKSMGGRYATYLAPEVDCAGAVIFGYPFHPPGKAATEERIAHLATTEVPTLILQGERDPFGTRDEVDRYALSPRVRCRFLADGDHSLKPRKSSGRDLDDNLDEAARAAAAFIRARA